MTQDGPATTGIDVRPIVPDEFEAFHRVFSRALGFGMPPESELEIRAEIFDWDRSLAGFDGDALVATAHSFPTELTLPGGATPTVAAVTAVAVAATHRRRGIVTRMMRRQLAEAADRGEPAAILLASESLIYGRYGYGLAASTLDIDIERRHGGLASPLRDPGRLRFAGDDEAFKVMPTVFDRFRRGQPGAIDRNADWWRLQKTLSKGDQTIVLYESSSGEVDGYARYRVRAEWAQGGNPDHNLDVAEMVSATDEAHEALWHHILSVDLVTKVYVPARPAHERLRWLLADPRRLRARALRDFLWLRPLDVAALLSARRYRTAGRLAIHVTDAMFEERSGTFVLEGGLDGATCERSGSPDPDLSMAVADLGAILLGGIAPSELAAAGRIAERSHGALARADLMFGSSPPPWCNTGF